VMRVCKRGHQLTPENLYTAPGGDSYCKRCHRIANTKKRQTRQAHSTSTECTALLDKLRRHEQWRDKTAFINNGTPGSRSGVLETLIRNECTRLAIVVTQEDVARVLAKNSRAAPVSDLSDLRAIEAAFGGGRFSG
jgi:RNA polymerase subunit RPABC4/transcription elongation factor Spt4